jgi:iron(III) transport system substrate-binding protein
MKLITSTIMGAVSAIALVAGSSVAFAAMDDITPQEKKLIDGAKAEGEVTVINPIFQERTAENLQAAFRKRYGLGDDFKFNNLRKGTGATIAQVTQEIKAGKFTVDVHIVSAPGFFDGAAKRGAFLELDSGQWAANEALVKKAGQYSSYPYVVTPLAYTFQPIWNASCPGMENASLNSYDDVLSPALAGKTIASDLTKSATYTNTSIALSKAGILNIDDVWAKLKAQDPAIEFRTEAKRQMVMSCERPLDMWNLTGRVLQAEQMDPSLKGKLKFGIYKEGQVMLGNQMAVLKGGPNPNAGKLFVEFMLSKEGADVYVADEILYSFRLNYTPPAEAQPYLFDLNKEKLVGMDDWVGAQLDFAAAREKWQTYFQ